MGVDVQVARRPGEDREPAVLRGHQYDGVRLILHELRGSQMAGPAQLTGVHRARLVAFHGLGEDDLLNLRAALAASDLGAEGEHFVRVGRRRWARRRDGSPDARRPGPAGSAQAVRAESVARSAAGAHRPMVERTRERVSARGLLHAERLDQNAASMIDSITPGPGSSAAACC